MWNGRREMHTEFRRENLIPTDQWKNLCIDGFIWLRTGTTEFSGSYEHGHETSGSITGGEFLTLLGRFSRGTLAHGVGYSRGELSYLAPLGSENISAPYFKQYFFGGVYYPQAESNTTPPSPKTEITNILFYILNFASIIKFKM
jgi:hypothetical protein